MPLLSTFSFHSCSLLISSSSVSAITAKSSAYSRSDGRATLNSLDMASMTIIRWTISALEVFLNDMCCINPRFTYLLTYLLTITNNSGLNPDLWCIPTFTHFMLKTYGSQMHSTTITTKMGDKCVVQVITCSLALAWSDTCEYSLSTSSCDTDKHWPATFQGEAIIGAEFE